MSTTKIIVTGSLLAALAAIFQSIPVLLSEAAVILTILSALPIYTASRLKPAAGILSFIVAALLIMFTSAHEALFFLCTNGIVGLSLGCLRYYKLHKPVIILISTAALTAALCIMNYAVGIPVFGTKLPGPYIIQILILFLFAAVYNFAYLLFADLIYKRIKI